MLHIRPNFTKTREWNNFVYSLRYKNKRSLNWEIYSFLISFVKIKYWVCIIKFKRRILLIKERRLATTWND